MTSVTLTIQSEGDSLSDLITAVKTAVSGAGLTIEPTSLNTVLEEALKECESHAAAEIARIKAMTAQVDASNPPINFPPTT